ncbi:MAG: hypothetical protein AAF958_01375 [Planctomycetota bacterium]
MTDSAKRQLPIDMQAAEAREAERRASEREAKAERAALIQTVERALEAAEFHPSTAYYRIAVLIAKVAGADRFDWTASRLADDAEIECTREHARNAVKELLRWRILMPVSKSRISNGRRGRPSHSLAVKIDREGCGKWISGINPVANDAEENAAKSEGLPGERINEIGEKSTPNRGEIDAKSGGNLGEIGEKSGRNLGIPSLCPPSPNPIPIPGPPSPAIGDGDPACERRSVDTVDRKKIFYRVDLERTATQIAVALKWPDESDWSTVWVVAALYVDGQLSKAEVSGACRGANATATRTRIGVFRSIIAERLGIQAVEFRGLFGRYGCRGGFPKEAPPRLLVPREVGELHAKPPPTREAGKSQIELVRELAATMKQP